MVARIETGQRGAVTGVTYIDGCRRRAAQPDARRSVVICAGAIETARLLLNSASDAAPHGLGNAHDQVGRNLQGHFSPMVFGLFEEPVYDRRGPGVTTASAASTTAIPGIIGGAMLADEFIMLPIIFWKRATAARSAALGPGEQATVCAKTTPRVSR